MAGGDILELFRTPLVLAPMAGGISTVELALAANRGLALSFLAGGYQRPEQLADQIVRFRAAADDQPFGVNLFVPASPSDVVATSVIEGYREAIRPEAQRLGVDLAGVDLASIRIDDWFEDKVGYLLAHPVPAVSFTFGLPDQSILQALGRAGSVLIATVTNPAEALQASAAGVDLLCVQAAAAGGHRATFGNYSGSTLELPELLRAVGDVAGVPMIAAGGIASRQDLGDALDAGAFAVQAGTAFLAAAESGASAAHKAALTAPGAETAITRAFTGRPARGIVNDFMRAHQAEVPAAYPQVHALTRPLRQAGAAAGDISVQALWAGTKHRQSSRASAEQIARDLLSD